MPETSLIWLSMNRNSTERTFVLVLVLDSQLLDENEGDDEDERVGSWSQCVSQ